ncbi:MAG: WXG100 family type VII secretion target [Catonella sp.]|nr:WXG100 family type VII secretion target [Catonella sp.]MDY6355708.1 WXG100 family type VII secretion target [Catonella sp.]
MATQMIQMTPDELTAESKKFTDEQGKLKDLTDKITKSVDTLADTWKGEASGAFVEQWKKYSKSFVKAQELLGDISTQLTKIRDAMVQSDADIASQIRK